MAEGITGWRLHVGAIFPTPVPPRAVLEFYEAVPEGVDMTTVSLTAGGAARTGFRRPAGGPSVAGVRVAGDHRHVERDRRHAHG